MPPNRIPSFLLHDSVYVTASPLNLLLNLSLQNEIFPSILNFLELLENVHPIVVINNFEIALYEQIFEHFRN